MTKEVYLSSEFYCGFHELLVVALVQGHATNLSKQSHITLHTSDPTQILTKLSD